MANIYLDDDRKGISSPSTETEYSVKFYFKSILQPIEMRLKSMGSFLYPPVNVGLFFVSIILPGVIYIGGACGP